MEDISQLFAAVSSGDAAAVRAMLDAEPELVNARNERAQSPFIVAVYNRQPELCDLLVERGARLELHEAAAAGLLDQVQQAVGKNAELANGYSSDGFAIMALAAMFGHLSVVQYLLEKGADVNAVANNGAGYTAMTAAATAGHKEIVALLLAHGANANHRYGPGFTPLHAAAAGGHLEVVRLLLDHGADLFAKTTDGRTAQAFAEDRKHAEVAALLRTRAAS
ncbi:MAG TPA: ankyrin repeat domain-containing protein [Candidatus Acidoferrum sp.]|jgi:ankyrin repeat protein